MMQVVRGSFRASNGTVRGWQLYDIHFSNGKVCGNWQGCLYGGRFERGLCSSKAAGKQRYEVNLPQTKFPMKADAAKRELENVDRLTWKLYEWQKERDLPRFVLHDGPPFANGSLHAGHFMNKCLKDFINRFKLLTGHRVYYVPGWDCHGLPIELKALQAQKGKEVVDRCDIREKSQAFAEEAIKDQRSDFIRWGIMGNWNDDKQIYKTMNKEFEGRQLQVFAEMASQNLVKRGLKPVYWSYSSRTALAEAEIEYVDDHKSPSIYVDFKLLHEDDVDDNTYLTIYTTTPWSLLGNVAVSVHPSADYCVLSGFADGRKRIIAKELLKTCPVTRGLYEQGALNIEKELKGVDLGGHKYAHPFGSDGPTSPSFFTVLCGNHVTLDAGTGLVHTAPAHGHDDYHVWLENGNRLEDCPCPVDDDGKFAMDETKIKIGSAEVWKKLQGQHIHETGNASVLELLKQVDAFAVEPGQLVHRYPYDWRTKKPVIIRATAQWFIELGSLKHIAEEALESVELVPQSSRGRLYSMLEGRNEWCISRQRAWGVPIPALFAQNEPGNNENVWLDEFTVRAASEIIDKHGTDWWFSKDEPVEETIAAMANKMRADAGLPPRMAKSWVRGLDTLDVWFDSGTSWYASKGIPEQDNTFVADLYLEGSDQHRGWFQSSLLTKTAFSRKPEAPFKAIVTHGFILDETGIKMSKSKGNTIAPDEVINGVPHKNKKLAKPAYGADVLRLWVASTDFVNDVSLGTRTISDASDSLRKIRNTTRFLIGNLYDFDPSKDCVGLDELEPIDRYILHETSKLLEHVQANYENFRFRIVYIDLMNFVSNQVSAFYGSSVKDRLYCEPADSRTRKACQTAMWHMLHSITVASAPIICFTAEDIYNFVRQEIGPFPGASLENDYDADFQSVFQTSYPSEFHTWRLTEPRQIEQWESRLEFRRTVNRLLERLRADGKISGSEQVILMTSQVPSWCTESELETEQALLQVVCQVNDVKLNTTPTKASSHTLLLNDMDSGISFQLVQKERCDRCRLYNVEESHIQEKQQRLCPRCSKEH